MTKVQLLEEYKLILAENKKLKDENTQKEHLANLWKSNSEKLKEQYETLKRYHGELQADRYNLIEIIAKIKSLSNIVK